MHRVIIAKQQANYLLNAFGILVCLYTLDVCASTNLYVTVSVAKANRPNLELQGSECVSS